MQDADFSSLVADDDAQDIDCARGEYGPQMDGYGWQRDIGADRLEMARASQRPQPSPHAHRLQRGLQPCATSYGCNARKVPGFSVRWRACCFAQVLDTHAFRGPSLIA